MTRLIGQSTEPLRGIPNYALVERDGVQYICMPTHTGLKCGRCLRGNVGWRTVLRDCLVCGAKMLKGRKRT